MTTRLDEPAKGAGEMEHNSKVQVYQDCPDLRVRLVARENTTGKAEAVFTPADCCYSPLCYPCLLRRTNREQQVNHNDTS